MCSACSQSIYTRAHARTHRPGRMFAADRVKLPVINYPTVLLLLEADSPPHPPTPRLQPSSRKSTFCFHLGAPPPLACVTGRRFMPPRRGEGSCGTAG